MSTKIRRSWLLVPMSKTDRLAQARQAQQLLALAEACAARDAEKQARWHG